MNPPEDNIKLLVLVGVSVMLLLFISFLLFFISVQRRKYRYHKHLQQLKEEQQELLIEAGVRSEETERLRIAEALHDEMGALLFSAKLHFQNIRLNEQHEDNSPLYKKGQEMLDTAIKKIRGISHNLHSSILQEFGLMEAISHFVQKTVDEHLIDASVALDCAYASAPKENAVSVYRTIQELINNVLRHAHPRKLRVSCASNGTGMVLTIYHDGEGLTQQRFEELRYKKESMGFKIIQNRLILLKGSLQFSERPDGYYIDLFLPI